MLLQRRHAAWTSAASRQRRRCPWRQWHARVMQRNRSTQAGRRLLAQLLQARLTPHHARAQQQGVWLQRMFRLCNLSPATQRLRRRVDQVALLLLLLLLTVPRSLPRWEAIRSS